MVEAHTAARSKSMNSSNKPTKRVNVAKGTVQFSPLLAYLLLVFILGYQVSVLQETHYVFTLCVVIALTLLFTKPIRKGLTWLQLKLPSTPPATL